MTGGGEQADWALQTFRQAGLTGTEESDAKDGYIPPDIIHSFPKENDIIFTLARLYKQEVFNCARSVEHNLVIRAVMRNYGNRTTADSNIASDTGMLEPLPLEAIKFPSPADIYDKVMGAIPDFLKARITQWAKDKKGQPIAREITSYVKTILGALPIPVPKILINAAANVVVPPLVQLIINKLGSSGGKAGAGIAVDFRALHDVTPQTHELTRDIDCSILQCAGISYADLPAPLSKAWQGPPTAVGSGITCLGQPLDREAWLSLKQFYDEDNLNGCKPMALTQVVTAQISTNPASDQDPTFFSPNVWSTLTDTAKSQLTVYAKMSPPSKGQMVSILYQPVCDLLAKDPYNVPPPIQPTFASMKVPEVIEWIIKTR